MQLELKRRLSWVAKHQQQVLFVGITTFTLLISLLCFAKYARLGYNAIDLGYFNQVFWNTVRGRPFFQTIHPHLSLGDHAEFAILLLAPFYALFQDPRTLLFLQALALALGAWPVYLLARDRFARSTSLSGRAAPLLFGFAWLANPILHNIAFFEFHILPFALTPLLFALLAYRREQKKSFLLWITLALLCREDVALVVMAIAFLAWLEKKSLWWKIVPFTFGATWFVGVMKMIGHFAPGNAYKFNVYYQWLGNSLPQVFIGATKHPMLVLHHITTIPNLEMILGFLMPYFFLPLLAPLTLVLALGPLAQVLLGAPGGSELVLDMHYATLFIPALTLATIDGFARFPNFLRKHSKIITEKESEAAAILGIIIAMVYGSFFLGPLPSALARMIIPGEKILQAQQAEALLSKIPKNAAVAASYSLMPILSSREHFYAAHYLFLGVTQFALSPYPTPPNLRYTLFDLEDLVIYQAQFPKDSWTAKHYAGGTGRLEAAIGEPIARNGRFVLFDRQASTPLVNYTQPPHLTSPVQFSPYTLLGAEKNIEKNRLHVTLEWHVPTGAHTDDLDLHIMLKKRDGNVTREASYAFEGLTPVTLRRNETWLTTVEMPLEKLPAGIYTPTIALERSELLLVLDSDRSLRLQKKNTTTLGDISLLPITLP